MDEEACLSYMSEMFAQEQTTDGLRRAPRSVEIPVSPLDGEAGLYSLEMGDADDLTELYAYFECVAIADDTAALMIMLITPRSAYEDALPTWNNLLAGIDVDAIPVDREGDRDDDDVTGGETSSDEGSFVDESLGIAITWDDKVWTGVAYDDADGVGVEFENDESYGYVITTESAQATPEECVGVVASTFEESESFKRVRKMPADAARIEPGPGGYGEVYTMLATDAPDKIAFYAECRPTSDAEIMLVIYLSAPTSDYDEVIDSWQGLVDGVEVTNQAVAGDEAPADSSASAEAGEFVGKYFEIAFAYDADLWELTTEFGADYDWASLTSDYGTVIVYAVESDFTTAECIEALLDDEQEYAAGEIDEAPRSYDLPATDADAEAAAYTYEAIEENGGGEQVVYFECREIEAGESLVAVTFVTSPSLYDDALPKLESVLATIEIG